MKFTLHPATQILVWVLLALMAQRLQPLALLLASAILLSLALRLSVVQLRSLLRRTRWILFSLLLIYAYTTPGAALWEALGFVSPTREGLVDGALQLGRLLSVLSGLAILLVLLPEAQLISGLYTLAYPLRWFGLSRERIAVRLALTLEYAEASMRDTASDWRSAIRAALQTSANGAEHVELRLRPFGLADAVALLAGAAVFMWVWR